MKNSRKYSGQAKTTKSERRKKPPHLQPSYNADWWKEFNRDDKKPRVIDQSKIRTLDAEKYPRPTLKKKKNEKRHNKTVNKRRDMITEEGRYFIDHDTEESGNLYKYKPASQIEEVYSYQRNRWIPTSKMMFHFFNEDILDDREVLLWYNHVLLGEKLRRVVDPKVLIKEALLCTGRVVKERNDSAFPSTIALEVYSVDLGLVFVKEGELRKYC